MFSFSIFYRIQLKFLAPKNPNRLSDESSSEEKLFKNLVLRYRTPPHLIRYMPNGRRVWAPNSSAGETAHATQGCDQGAMAKPPHLSR